MAAPVLPQARKFRAEVLAATASGAGDTDALVAQQVQRNVDADFLCGIQVGAIAAAIAPDARTQLCQPDHGADRSSNPFGNG